VLSERHTAGRRISVTVVILEGGILSIGPPDAERRCS